MSPRPYRYRPDRRSFDDFTNMFVPIFKDTPPLFLASILPSTPAMPNGIAAHSKPTTQIYALAPAEILGLESFRQASCIEATIPEPEAALAHQPVAQKKAPAKFALGGSFSSNEQGMTVKMSKSNLVPSPKERIFQIAGSCRPASTKSDIQPAKPIISEKIKQVIASTSRNSQLKAESAINSDTDDDYVDESAIDDDDDDDDSDCEDSAEESGESSVDDKFFQRVESKTNLVSHPSLITLMVAQNERQNKLSNQASHSTSTIKRERARPNSSTLGAAPNDSDEGPLMIKGIRPSNLKSIIKVPQSSAQPIETRHVGIQAAFSPRTTRRNMLATELTESLRRHLLWERQQKTSTANAVLKRRHTSHDVANLKQFPEKPCLKKSEDANAISWNQYFNKDAFDGYHSRGW